MFARDTKPGYKASATDRFVLDCPRRARDGTGRHAGLRILSVTWTGEETPVNKGNSVLFAPFKKDPF